MTLQKTFGLSVLALTMFAGTAVAQVDARSSNGESRDAIGLARAVSDSDTTLAEAIEAAESHSDGVAIASRVVYDVRSYDRLRRGSEKNDSSKSKSKNKKNEANRPNRPVNDENAQRWERSRVAGDGAAYIVVTCVIDNTRVRDVLVNMDSGEVVDMRASMRFETGAERSWRYAQPNRDDSAMSWRDRVQDDFGVISMMRASTLMNADVENPSGDTLGTIDDLAIDLGTGRVLYGALFRGGFLGIGDSVFAIPSDELARPVDGVMYLSLEPERLDEDGGFDTDRWPMRGDDRWDTNWTTSSDSEDVAHFSRASDVIGTTLRNLQGESLGEVTDMVVEPRLRKVTYLVVEVNDDSVAVPMASCELHNDALRANVTKTKMNQLTNFDANEEFDWNNAFWNRETHEIFGVTPFWVEDSGQQSQHDD